MADTFPFTIDGRSFPDMPVIDFKISYVILDGEGTGRMEGVGWPLFRDPEGCIINADILCGTPDNYIENQDFKDLIAILKSFGTVDFMRISLVTPSGSINQDMYCSGFDISGRKIYRNGKSYWGTVPIKFVAKEGYRG